MSFGRAPSSVAELSSSTSVRDDHVASEFSPRATSRDVSVVSGFPLTVRLRFWIDHWRDLWFRLFDRTRYLEMIVGFRIFTKHNLTGAHLVSVLCRSASLKENRLVSDA